MIITNLNLSALKYFIDTIELGSLTEAANKNAVSRPAISQAIRRLEDVVGYELISHKKNILQLTDQGRLFLQKAKLSLERLNHTFLEETEASDKIDIACSNTLAEYLVLPALKKFKTLPEIKLQVGTTSGVRQKVSEGSARIGFVIDDGQNYGLQSKNISEGKFGLYSKSGSFDGPLITTQPRPEVVELLKILKRKNKLVKAPLQLESWTACRKAAEILSGSCLIPDLMSGHGLRPVKEFKYEHRYRVQAIFKDLNRLTQTEVNLLRICGS